MRLVALLAAWLGAAFVVAATACRSERADPTALLIARDLGLTDLQRGRLPEAEAQFKKVVALAPRDPLGYANLGLTYLQAGRFTDAEEQLRRARRLDTANAEVGLITAKLYSLTGRPAEARATLDELGRDARVLYALAALEALSADRLREVLTLAPANLAVRLQLVEALVRRGDADSAARHLEDVPRLRPAPPREATPHLDAALRHLRAGRLEQARVPLDRFLRVMEVTAPYQSSLSEVQWVEGPLVGRAVLAFNPQTVIATRALVRPDRESAVRFTDVTDEAGLSDRGISPTALAIGDFDGDGTDNLFLAGSSRDTRRPIVRVYSLQGGFVMEAPAGMGIPLPAGAVYATVADFDNDGWLDLFAIGGDERGYLLRNDRSGKFVDATAAARLTDVGDARKALFVDLDHDGDLDLLLVGGLTIRHYRNNLDGTFTDVAGAAGLQGAGAGRARDAAFGDFDGDGRTDLFVARPEGADALYRNTGFQRFEDVTAASGLATSRGSAALAVGDYDNDGRLDLFTLSAAATLWRNEGNGTFARDHRSDGVFQRLRLGGGLGAEFVDYDNDGWLDLLVAGRLGPVLLHNTGNGQYEDRSTLLPAALQSSAAVAGSMVSDVDDDGDQDFFVADSGGVYLLRNEGGNARLAMQVQLMALRTGSGKNNTFGIGSTLEVRAGEIYQTRVVTDRVTHFGLGPHLKADVLRVQWTNGVPQTIYFPGTDQDVLELEQLKGSCAFLYTWDGKGFRFVTDVMWRSALGMPLGIMGGGRTAAYAPAGASQEYLRIPGDALQSRNGRYVLQVTEELWETAYLDEVRLLAVDHPETVEVFVDERFVPPGPVQLRLFQAVRRRPAVSATGGEGDDRGEDVLAALRERDDVYVSNLTPIGYQGLVEPHDLILDLGEDAGQAGTFLFLRGWIYPTDASINVALSQQSRVRTRMPSLEVRDAHGRWTTAVANIGFPSGKDKTIVIDLAGLFPTNDHRVRIRTNMQIYWDHAFVAHDAPPVASPVRVTPLVPVSADLHFRGFSRMYRRGGRNGPHWFAYEDVSMDSPWRPIEGAFTRFGDVLPLLGSADDRYVIMAPGDEVTIEFDAARAGAPPPGWRRTFILYTDGWIKDADLNTAFGNTVEPLPFHAAGAYPYRPGESYPSDSTHERYRREYNTRIVQRRRSAQ